MQLLLLGTEGCHLCEQAEQLLAEYMTQSTHDINLNYIDISEQDAWQALYETRIPVLLHPQSKQDLGWPFDKEEINTFLNSLKDW